LGALVKLIPEFGDGIYHALTARDEALKDEKRHLQLDLLCRLAEKIDDAVNEIRAQGDAAGVFEVAGTINVKTNSVDDVAGIDVGRPTRIQPGTVVNVDATDAKTATGVKIR
jgi:hypothetical protein